MMSLNIERLARIAAIVTALMLTLGSTATLVSSADADDRSHSSATGFFGLDEDDRPIVDRNGIMLMFDGAITPETVSNDTFEVWLDQHTRGAVVEVQVDGAYVFLRLRDELASNAMPVIQIAEGQEIEDLAGNSTDRRKLGPVRIADGIMPQLTVILSGGSGVGTGNEGADRLTNDSIEIHITSDEPLQGAPRVVVVCKGLRWTENIDASEFEHDIDDFIANRNGPFAQKPGEPKGTSYTCGYDPDSDGIDAPFELTEDIANSRPGDRWEYSWSNRVGPMTALRDGELAVVVYGRDRSRYQLYGETVSNWSTGTSAFDLDSRFESGRMVRKGRVYPSDGTVVREKRPFVLIEFLEISTVSLKSVMFDGVEIKDEFERVAGNEFVFWPLSMNRGEHEVEVEVTDSARNSLKFDFSFTSTSRGDFVIPLVAGWNAISLPADPIDPATESVFTDPAIETVIEWDSSHAGSPWAIATRNDSTWRSLANFRELTEIRTGSGYWVKCSGYTQQPVSLRPTTPLRPPPEPTARFEKGWRFVGVIDGNGNQTENHFGTVLVNSTGDPIRATEYLGNYEVALTWDPIDGRYIAVSPNETIIIGQGIWVYYGPI